MRAQASAKVWAGRVLACGHGRKPLGPECEKVLHNWRRRRGLGQHGSGHDRKARRNARACRERPGDHQQTLYQREQLHRQLRPAAVRSSLALSWRKLLHSLYPQTSFGSYKLIVGFFEFIKHIEMKGRKTNHRTSRSYFDFMGRLRSTRIWWAQM